jgi:GST-like protein
MIHAYTWPTPNGHKLHIMLEECELDYEVHPVNIGVGDQFEPEFLKFSPNNKMPAIIDDEGPGGGPISIFESGAILYYLAQKTGRFMPPLTADPRGHYAVMEWLMFQMGGVGPMLGQNHHFNRYAPEKIPYAIDRYVNETARLYGVIDRRLGVSPWLAGPDYSIADIATFPWLRNHEGQGQKLEDFPHLKKWFEAIAARPAVERGVSVLKDARPNRPLTDEERANYFGSAQYQRR